MVMDRGDVAVWPATSVARIVNEDVPDAVGVPETEFPDSERPPGIEPALTDQVYGGLPPVAEKEVAA